jgi:hypothetical protein
MIHETGYWDSKQAENYHIHSPNVSSWISNFLKEEKERILYDFGCGIGNYLNDFHGLGFQKLIGFEADPIKKHSHLLIERKNLTEEMNEHTEKGNVMSLEVGEHIPKIYQDVFIENVTKMCDKYLIFSWAVKGQGGYGHVNELNNDEILPLFLDKGFVLLEEETKEVRSVPENFCSYFRNTLFVLKKI